VIDIFSEDLDTAGVRNFSSALIDPVQAFKKRTLSAAGWADQRRDLVSVDVHSEIFQRLEVSIPKAEFVCIHDVVSVHSLTE
jgi:hypothetical protein